MNRLGGTGSGEARLRYLDGEFEVVVPGTHVLCAVTGAAISLDALRYWSVERQEAYADVRASLTAQERAGRLPRKSSGPVA